LEIHLEQRLPLISGDPYQLRAAVDCLLDNALKFTPGGGRVQVRVYAESGQACLAVTDTGIGIKEHEVSQVFAPFFQLDGSSTRRYEGLGLGLTVAKAVVEGHSGQIQVTSQPGQGSCFTVKLPTMSPRAQAEGPAVRGGALRRILVVDDEENVAQMLHDGLEKLPECEVAIATSGAGALQRFEQGPFDLLITDYKMPGTDGMTLATHVRHLYPQTAIIMITAYNNHRLRQQAISVRVQRILDKPVELNEIRGAVVEALETRSRTITDGRTMNDTLLARDAAYPTDRSKDL
jgi:CheY-like chemotaxis protein